MFNFRYHLNQQNWQKVNEIAQNIFELHRENLEEVSTDLIFLQERWGRNQDKVKEEL